MTEDQRTEIWLYTAFRSLEYSTVQLEQFLNIALPRDKEQFQNLAQCPTEITDAINSEQVSVNERMSKRIL